MGLSVLLVMAFPLSSVAQTLPPIPIPIENPWTPEKALLGKILFWEQQLSSDTTIACGSCHSMAHAGTEAAPTPHPGFDGLFGTADDQSGSMGVRRRNVGLELVEDPIFGFSPQVTGRAAPNFFGGLWASNLLMDGRATDEFRDPITGNVVIPTGGGLESQALIPILDDVEMAKEGRTWNDVIVRLRRSPPLILATDVPTEMAEAISRAITYPDLFAEAFGDPEITPVRIAFAIASYERTLVADQTPWDDFMAGDSGALTSLEKNGWNLFELLNCSVCHAPPTFTDDSFRTIGVRDPSEDEGREAVTGDPADRGAFKVPTLRNVGLKQSFFHTGDFMALADVLAFYSPGQQGSVENIDPLMPVGLSSQNRLAVAAFFTGGLTDPRVAGRLPPFDQPTLGSVPVPEPGFAASLFIAGLALSAPQRRRRKRARSLAGLRDASATD